MRCLFAICFILLLFYDKGLSDDSENIKQEAAKVLYANPEHIKNINIITIRHSRKSPYLTSCNATTFYTWENNVTVVVSLFNSRTKQDIFTIDFKVCDAIKVQWAKDWLKLYTNVPSQCPLAAQTFMFNELELPPKNFPFPIPPGEYNLGVTFVTTKTKEKILDIKCNIKVGKKVI